MKVTKLSDPNKLNREDKREYWRQFHNKKDLGTWQEFNAKLYHETPKVGKQK